MQKRCSVFDCRKPRRSRVCGVLPILAIIVLVLLLGISAWALYVGLNSTQHVVSNFWSIVAAVETKVRTKGAPRHRAE